MTENAGSMSDKKTKTTSFFLEVVRTVVYAVLIAGVLRTVAFEPFNIPSKSMLPTLRVGDYLFVSKYAYGYSRHSMPFSPPLFDGRIFEDQPARGDVVVFKLPADDSTDYIKRVVGLPGDRIEVTNGVLSINGTRVKRERVEDYVTRDRFGNVRRLPQYRETLPNGESYLTLDTRVNSELDNYGPVTVPEGHYFMMGDNRDNSQDSRVPSAVGFVPAENLVGRAEFLFFSTDSSAAWWQVWRWPFAWRWDRFFQGID